MSLDSDIPVRVRHRREVERNHAEAEREWREQQAQDEHERDGGQWRSIFRRQAAEQPAVHYSERPGMDLRVFAVEGDLIEQARRDAERHDLPGMAS